MGCGKNIYRNGCDPTREFINQVMQQIATRSVRDSDFPEASELTGNEYVAITQDGESKKVTISEMFSGLGKTSILVGTTAYWNSMPGYIPDKGTVIVYTDHGTTTIDGEVVSVPALKIGSGNAYLADLAFVDQDLADAVFAHINNISIHVSQSEKDFWNNKLNVTDGHEVVEEVLIFTRN